MAIIHKDNPPIKLWAHQQRVVDIFAERTALAIFHEPGCGKTKTAATCLKNKCTAEKRPLRTLILCPMSVMTAWQREITAVSERLGKGVQILTGSGEKRLKQLWDSSKHIYITNPEAITACPKFWAKMLTLPWDFLIIDESHRFKEPKSKRLQKLIPLACRAKYRLILTGSPVLQDERDLWAQFRILDEHICGANFYAFQNRHFHDVNAGKRWLKFPDYQMKATSRKYFDTILSTHSHRVEKKDCLDLPPLVRTTRLVDLSPEILKHYREMERDFLTELDNNEVVTADIVLTKLLRLQQICCGILKDTNGTVTLAANNKLSELKELLDDLCPQHKVIVWCNFRDSINQIDALCADLGLYNVIIQGGQTAKERQLAIDEFNTNPKYTVCIANQAAGGVGIGLQAASYMIYYAKSFKLEDDIQSEARAHRGGSEIHEKITRIDLVTAGTVEEEITEALRAKKDIGELLFQFRKRAAA